MRSGACCSSPAARVLLLFIALAATSTSCVSSKEKIERAVESMGAETSGIREDATASKAEITGSLALDLPDRARPLLLSASKRQDRIIDRAHAIDDDRDDAREGLDGVKDSGSLWRKLKLTLFGIAIIFAVLQFGPALLPGAFAWTLKAGIGLSRSVRSSAKLLRDALKSSDGPERAKLDATIAAKREDPRFEAAWQREKRAERKREAERAKLKAEVEA